MTTLTVNPTATKAELINDALAFSKYSGDAEAMEYLNAVMSELRWDMSVNEYKNFQDQINHRLSQEF